MLLKCSKELCTFIVAFWNWKPYWTNLEKGKTKKVMLFSTKYLFFYCFSKLFLTCLCWNIVYIYCWKYGAEELAFIWFLGLCGPRTSVDRENEQPSPPPVIKLACSFRAVRVCFEIGDRLPHDRISSEWFTSKPASRNLIFASKVYDITVCSCAAVKTRVKYVTCYISRTQVTWPKVEAIIRQNNTLTTSKILKSQKQRNSFKAIKDILLIVPSKTNGILRIIKAKFDGKKRRNMQHTAEFAKWPRWVNLSVLYIGRFAYFVM